MDYRRVDSNGSMMGTEPTGRSDITVVEGAPGAVRPDAVIKNQVGKMLPGTRQSCLNMFILNGFEDEKTPRTIRFNSASGLRWGPW